MKVTREEADAVREASDQFADSALANRMVGRHAKAAEHDRLSMTLRALLAKLVVER